MNLSFVTALVLNAVATGLQYGFDIMDGSFVPNFTLGPDIMRAVAAMTDLPSDAHLMTVHLLRRLSKGSDQFNLRKRGASYLKSTRRAVWLRSPGLPLVLCQFLFARP